MSKYMEIPMKDEWFVHFTRPEYAELIIKSKKILTSKSTSVSGEAFAISTLFGVWSPYLPSDILNGNDNSHVAIIFQTSVKPKDIDLGQVVWNKDIIIKKAKIIKFSKAKDLVAYKREREYSIPTMGTPPIKYI